MRKTKGKRRKKRRRTGSMEPEEDWDQYLVEAGNSPHSAKIHAVTFANEKLSVGTLQMLDRAMLPLKQHMRGHQQLSFPTQPRDDSPTVQEVPDWLGGLC